MALPIQPTPTLKGKDAIRFIKEKEKAENRELPDSVYDRMKKNYKELSEAFKKS